MKMLEFEMAIRKSKENHRNPYENDENHENLIIPFENNENHENLRIPLET